MCVCVCVPTLVFIYKYIYIYKHGCAGSSLLLRLSLVVALGGSSLVPGCRLLCVLASLVVPRLWGMRASVVLAPGL